MVIFLPSQEGKLMIVRTWHGCVPLEHAESFAKHLEKTGIEHSRSISGNKGAFVRRETQGGWEHFFLATYWQDLDWPPESPDSWYHLS
jgi:hypothetical protein